MVTTGGRVLFSPSSSTFWVCAASYLLPAHYPVSAWTEHAPFAAWLVDVLRPRSVVELGTHLGYSCFAFAEAARILGIDVTVSALDSWEGDEGYEYRSATRQ